MKYYRRIQSCTKYQRYEFGLKDLTQQHHALLRDFVQTFGESSNPPHLKVLHVKHHAFFIDFPAYGFPVFKISFYKHISPQQAEYYLDLINDYLTQLLQPSPPLGENGL
jgi:hypothetical protein